MCARPKLFIHAAGWIPCAWSSGMNGLIASSRAFARSASAL